MLPSQSDDAKVGTLHVIIPDHSFSCSIESERAMINQRKEELRVKSARTRAKQQGTLATLTIAEWLGILEYFQYRCAYCGTTSFDVIDHVIALKDGGGSVASNVVPACYSCNGLKDRSGSQHNPELIAEVAKQLTQFLDSHGPFRRIPRTHREKIYRDPTLPVQQVVERGCRERRNLTDLDQQEVMDVLIGLYSRGNEGERRALAVAIAVFSEEMGKRSDRV